MTVLTKCYHPIRIKNKRSGEYMFVPCGHCPACAAAKRKAMANRLQIEMDHCISALFITLTYDNNNVPYSNLDIELFFQRLRNNIIYKLCQS